MPTERLLDVDARGRISLGKLGKHARYLATEEPDGTIVLQPAEVITKAQANFNAMPRLQAGIDAFLADPSGAVERPRPRRG